MLLTVLISEILWDAQVVRHAPRPATSQQCCVAQDSPHLSHFLRTFYEILCIVFGVLVCSVVVEFGTVDSASLRGFVPLGWKPTEEEHNIIDSDRFRTLNIPRAAMCGSMWLDIASWECWEVEFWNQSTLHSSAGSKQMASDGQSCFFQCVRAPKGMCSHISHGTWFALLAAEFLGSKIKMVAVNIKRLLLRFLQPISIMFLVQPNDTERLKLTQRNFAQGP